MKDYYKILEINHTATNEEIKKSYRKLALKHHPDRNSNSVSSENIFKEIVEAYQILSDQESRKKYDASRFQHNQQFNTKSQTKERSITANDILSHFISIRKQVIGLNRNQIKHENLFKNLDSLLTDNIINFLLEFNDIKINKLIINEILICCKYLPYKMAELLIIKAAKIGGTNNNILLAIYRFNKKLKLWSYWDKIKGLVITSIVIVAFITAINFSDSSTVTKNSSHQNGELNNTFIDSPSVKIQIPQEKSIEDNLKSDGWEEMYLENGQLPSCYNFQPKRGKVSNYLEVNVGSGTDVSVKVMNKITQKCVRYVYITSGSSFRIKNIPTGVYYLKIAYGKQWFSKVENGKCVGKFIKNPLYEKGTDILDYNIKYSGNTYSVPSFRLSLDVVTNNANNSFNSSDISEDEFNL